MASNVSGPGNRDFEQYEQIDEDPGQTGASTSTARPSRQQLEARYQLFEAQTGTRTDELPDFDEIGRDRLIGTGPAPGYEGGGASASTSTQPTSRMRRMFTALGSSSTLGTQAGASRTSLPGSNLAGEAPPPVPALPASVRRRRQATGATAGPSGPQGAANLAVPEEAPAKKGGIFSKMTPEEKRANRNHKLRDAVTNGDHEGVTRRLNKGADPAARSAINQQNAFHKLASSKKFEDNTTRALIGSTVSLGQAAIAQDVNGNTPVHLAQHSLGKAETNRGVAEADRNQAAARRDRAAARLNQAAADGNRAEVYRNQDLVDRMQKLVDRNQADVDRIQDFEDRYRDVRNTLTQAARDNGHDIDSITNNEGRTPQQMREAGRQVVETANEREDEYARNLQNIGF